MNSEMSPHSFTTMKEAAPPTTPAGVNALISHMDAMLAQGRGAVERLDEFYRVRGLTPGFGKKELLSERVPDRHRTIFAKMLARVARIDQEIDEIDPRMTTPAPIAASTRAAGSRFRI